MHWDLLIRGARVFDGSGGPGRIVDLAVRDGRIAALGSDLPVSAARTVREAAGRWLIPGLLDIHTHEDLEVELEPGLPEVVRHGTTSVIAGNCSIGLAFGNQRRDGQDPIVDCFARVENIPKPVLRKAADKATWRTTAEYLTHLDSLPLGANLAPLVPHSMLRIEVMGLADSLRRDPTADELAAMTRLLEQALDEGYIGFSTDGLPLHFLANQPNLDKRIPTQYAKFAEYRALTAVLRRYDRVWQMTPATDDGALTLKLFALTSGRLYGRPLRVTALAALDAVNNRFAKTRAKGLARLFNSRLLGGRFRLQALAAPFKIWSEGVVSPLAEGHPLLRRLIATEPEDGAARRAILSDPAFVDAFRAQWAQGKSGFGIARLRRRLRLENELMTRDLNDMVIQNSPVPDWQGRTMDEIYRAYRRWLGGAAAGADQAALAQPPEQPRTPTQAAIPVQTGMPTQTEVQAFEALGRDVRDDGEFFLALLRHFDRDLYWYYITANRNPEVVKELLLNPALLPGFNDSGAHVTNMAYYDGNLRALKIGAVESEALFSRMLARLTREPAEFFGLDAGTLDIGAQADLVLLDPDALRAYDGEQSIRYQYRPSFECHQLVNRSDGVVDAVYIRGRLAWHGSGFTPEFGTQRLGRALTATRGTAGLEPGAAAAATVLPDVAA